MLDRVAALTAVLAVALVPAAEAKGGKGSDRDRDGLKDKVEAAAGLDPKKADSDGDGVEDGREGAGEVVRVRGDKVTIKLLGGGTVRALLDEDTKLVCPEPEEDEELLEDEDAGEDVVDDGAELFSTDDVVDEVVEDEVEDEEDEEACSADDVAAGVAVAESTVKGKGKRARWTRLVLAD